MTDLQAQSDWVRESIDRILEGPGGAEEKLTRIMGGLKDYPLEYVMFNFPWKDNEAIRLVPLPEPYRSRFPGHDKGPDLWACEFLDQLGEEIRERGFDGSKAVRPIRFSTSSGHGIGKSVMVSWLIMFIMDTRPYSMGVVTANTSDQLRTKTWAELAKWHSIAKTAHFWNYSNSRGSMSLSRNGSKTVSQKWRTDAMTARAENAEAFQGLHAANSVPFYIFDEASGIDDAIWSARMGGASDGMPMSFDFGNPTRKSGQFFENCVGARKDRFIVRQIDSRSVHVTNKGLFQEWLEDYGEDSDLFKVKVRGVFPSTGSVQFIGTDLVDAAMSRPATVTSPHDPLVIGCDIARFGDNDTILYPRIGYDARSHGYKRYNGLDQVEVMEKIIELVVHFQSLGRKCDGLFVDGGGLGAGPVDMLRRAGWNPIDINFGGRSSDPRYRYKGDQMWAGMRDALPSLILPYDIQLKQDLTQREYSLMESMGKITLESKKMMRERGVSSPDVADALALTFAHQVHKADAPMLHANAGKARSEYNPLETNW